MNRTNPAYRSGGSCDHGCGYAEDADTPQTPSETSGSADTALHGLELGIDAAAFGKISLQDAGKFAFRGNLYPLSARISQAARIAKLNQGVIVAGAEFVTHGLAFASVTLSFANVISDGGSNQSLAKFSVAVGVTALANWGHNV